MKKVFKTTLKVLGVLVGGISLLFIAGVYWPLDAPNPRKPISKLLLTNISLVDVENGIVKEGMSILVENGDIAEIGENLDLNNAQVTDMGGAFAIPGLFDMHAHSLKMAPYLTHPLFVASGVTAIRDMGGCIGVEDQAVACVEDKREWTKKVENGTHIGPRYDQVTSLAIDGGAAIPNGLDTNLGVSNSLGAKLRAEYDKARGIDFLKTYTNIPREGYFALAKEAQKNQMYIAGHLPFQVSAFEAIKAGQKSFEHAFLFIWECFPDVKEVSRSKDPFSLYNNEMRMRMIREHDPEICSNLMKKMAEAGTAFVPTHTTRKLDAYALDEAFRSDQRLKYIPHPLRVGWIQDGKGMARRAGEGGEESFKAFYEFGLKQTGIAHKAGVSIMAGMDAPDSFAFPGLGLADELEHFIQAGLTPLDALRSATLVPAKFLGLEGKAGVLKAGARADIVFLEENPLENIGAVRGVKVVVLAGSFYGQNDLQDMLSKVEANANSFSMWPKFFWRLMNSPITKKQFAD